LVDPKTADGETKHLLDGVQQALGATPNFIRALANSPSALRAFLGLHGIASSGSLDAATRERIALAVAEQNACQYCVSAHTAIGRKAGLDSAEMLNNRLGRSSDERAEAALRLAKALVERVGDVGDADLAAVRSTGLGDAEIVEIVTHVALNVFTNMLAKSTRIDIDFPEVALGVAA
jgi:uncharacterized peroxidase-related enzyme